MIPRKSLQLLLYILRIVYVFGEVDLNKLQRTDDFTDNPLQNYIEYTTERNDLYREQSTSGATEEFPNETTLSTGNELLIDDRSKENDLPIDDDLLQEFKFILYGPSYDDNNETVTYEGNQTDCNLWTDDGQDLKDVENLTANSVGTAWIHFTWFPPCDGGLNVTLTYLMEICSGEKCSQTNTTRNEYNATNLDPCTEYIFTIKLTDENQESNGVNITASTSHDIAEIGEVQNFHSYPSTNSVRLTWDAPVIHPMCVKHYTVTRCIEDSCNNVTVTSHEYIAESLEPCTNYFFAVTAVSEINLSASSNASVTTLSPKPSKPLYPTIKPGSSFLYIEWQPPETGAHCIKHYRITLTYSQYTTTKESTGTNVTIDGLDACTSYDIYITAVNNNNDDGDMLNIIGETSPAVSNPPVLDKNPLAALNNILLTWKILEKNNNCSVTSLITECNYTVTNGHGYEITNGKTEIRIDSNVPDKLLIVNSTVKNLSPYTTYICRARIINKAGVSQYSEPVNVITHEDVPSAPMLSVDNITDSHFVFVWDTPEYLAGSLHVFEIVFEWEELYPIPDWCTRGPFSDKAEINGSLFNYEYLEAKAFTKYRARIRAKTTAGWGNYSEYLLFQTDPKVPEAVSNFQYIIQENETDSNVLDTILSWSLPCSSNGIIEYFSLSVSGTRKNYTSHSFSTKKYIHTIIDKHEVYSINLHELKGEYNYTFEVCAKVKEVTSFGVPSSHKSILYPAGIPPQPDEEYIKSITIDPYKARRSTTTASVLLPLFPNTNGDILYYSIIISELGHNTASYSRFELIDNAWPNMSAWEDSWDKDFTIPYQATRPHWDPYPSYVADYGHMKAVKYVLGEDTTCKEISCNSKQRLYCNGPLKPDTWYHVRMRAFTHGGYNDSTVFVIKTNAEINVGIVIGIVFGILFLGILTTMMLLVRKCSPQAILRRFLHSDMPGSPVPAPLTRKKFISHCQQLVDNPGKLSNEFRLLQTLSVDLQMPTNSACLQANRKKNRYSDILPYDFSRVKLEVIDNDPNTDYINASFIRGFTGEDEYIACQGPKEETTYDFWRMMDQYNVNIIVMLTQLVEKGKEKCHQYFPAIRETFRYENMTIRCTSELDYRTYTQRTLVLQKENKKRNITHLHFKDWPDHDVPEDFDPMIHFCQIMRRNILANKGYVVIHCSAGIGRTGTLIAIDILLQHLRDNRKLDVFGTVYRLRHHRINMVQRESQYAYIYNCIKQVLKNPYCLKSCKPPPVDPVYENTSKKVKAASHSNTNLVNNFETLRKCDFFVSMDSIKPLYGIFSWPSRKSQTSTMNNGLRYCKSTSALDKKTQDPSLEESDSLDCLIYEILQNTTNESNTENSDKNALKSSMNTTNM